jgi:IS4 transposase
MTSNDECVDIKITKNRMNHIKNEKMKKELLEMEKIRLRITKIKLENKEEEHLISNLYIDETDYKEIKELYAQRWEIEKSFNVLKNKLEIENISGLSKIAIEQDFNAQILVHNIIQDVKNETERRKTFKKN